MTEIALAAAPAKADAPAAPKRRLALTPVVVSAALAAGVVFRLFHPGAIEYHSDEYFSFHHLVTVLHGGPWPALGMTMSIGGANPGMSVWIFILLGLINRPTTPVGLAEAVQVLNVIALLSFTGFVLRVIPRPQREPWLWAAALWAVNPIAIIYERKIWPPSTLPIFIVAMLAGWWYRRTWAGSFAFALLTVLGGQIHPTCAFLGACLLAWTLADDYRSFRVTGLVAGAAIGFLPAVNWALGYGGNSLHKLRLPLPTFYGRWFTTPFGYGADHILGPVEFPRFLGWPEIGGGPTYVVLVLYLAMAVVALTLLSLAGLRLLRSRQITLRWVLLGASPAGRIVRAAFFGFGMILTLLTIRGGGLYPHYMIVITPIMTLWVALVAATGDGGAIGQRGRSLLTALCVIDAALVLMMFNYIQTVGDIHGDFGPSWEWQQQHPHLPARPDHPMAKPAPA
ncbi:MAG: hypothetical protein WDM84_00995 [Bauldia sp.]